MDAIDLSGLSIADAILSEPDRGTFGDAPRPPVSPKLVRLTQAVKRNAIDNFTKSSSLAEG